MPGGIRNEVPLRTTADTPTTWSVMSQEYAVGRTSTTYEVGAPKRGGDHEIVGTWDVPPELKREVLAAVERAPWPGR